MRPSASNPRGDSLDEKQPIATENANCERTVIRQAQSLEEHRGLRTRTEWSFRG